jgi:glycosyltransferase involved in cell wall biosynthesis
MTPQPIVSILLPVYNRPEFLVRALASVQKQTFQHWECVIIDDGSIDTTVEEAEKFVQKDPRFRLLKLPHGGESKALNEGMYASRGKFLTILGSDDEYLPTHLSLRVEELEAHPSIDLLRGGLKIEGDEYVLDKRDLTKKISLYDPEVFVGGTFFGKREVFITLDGFKKMPYASDSDFMVRAMKTFNVKRVPWPTYIYYRNHEDSITKRLEKQMEQSLSV